MQRQLGGFSQPRSRQMGEEPQYEALAQKSPPRGSPKDPTVSVNTVTLFQTPHSNKAKSPYGLINRSGAAGVVAVSLRRIISPRSTSTIIVWPSRILPDKICSDSGFCKLR